MEIEESGLKFTRDRYATLDDYAIIGDVHLGFEEKLNESGYNIPLFSKTLEDKILSIESKRLIMLGDVKESILSPSLYYKAKIRQFFSRLSERFDQVVITKGNHDGRLESLAEKNKNIKVVHELVYGNFLFLHGHRMPDKDDLKRAQTLCSAHLHPTIRLTDSNGAPYYEDCWLLFDLTLPTNKFGKNAIKNGVVFPAFNEFVGHMEEIKDIGFMKYARNVQRLTTDLVLLPMRKNIQNERKNDLNKR